jgi:hypothetical protein
MEAILTKTVTKIELDSTYKSDSLNIHDELVAHFKTNNPGIVITGTTGETSDNGDGTFTYSLIIEFE